MTFHTLTEILEGFATTARELLGLEAGSDQVYLGTVRPRDVDAGYRLSLWINEIKSVAHEAQWRRTARITLALVARDDSSRTELGATEMLRLVERFDPLALGMLDAGRAKTHGFEGMSVAMKEPADSPGITANGYDDTDVTAHIGVEYEVLFSQARNTQEA